MLDKQRAGGHNNAATSGSPCAVANVERDPWHSAWHLREDTHGRLWLLGNTALGFAGNGYPFAGWDALERHVEVPQLKRLADQQGVYWVAA